MIAVPGIRAGDAGLRRAELPVLRPEAWEGFPGHSKESDL